MKTECDKRGHDYYLTDNEDGKVIYKCMYCPHWKFALNKENEKDNSSRPFASGF